MHTPVLIPDHTLWIQLALFLASYAVLKYLVFNPMMQLIELRRSKTTGLVDTSHAQKQKALELQNQYQTFMASERKKVTNWLETERKKVDDEARQTIQVARDQATKELQRQRLEIRTHVAAAHEKLMPLVAEFSGQIASKLLSRPVTVSEKILKESRGLDAPVNPKSEMLSN